MNSERYSVQESWTVDGKTFSSQTNAQAYAQDMERRDRASALLNPVFEALDPPARRGYVERRLSPQTVVEVMASNPAAFIEALQILQGGY